MDRVAVWILAITAILSLVITVLGAETGRNILKRLSKRFVALCGSLHRSLVGVWVRAWGAATATTIRAFRAHLGLLWVVTTIGVITAVLAAPVPLWHIGLFLPSIALTYVALRRVSLLERLNRALAQEHRNKTKELQATLAQLTESDRLAAMVTLAAGVAHQLNNPLFAILGRAELILMNQNRYLRGEKAVEYIRIIHEMAATASTIVRNLLLLSRKPQSFEAVWMPDLFEACLTLMENEIKAKKTEIVRDWGQVERVRGSSTELQQVVLNLLANAIEAVPSPGGKISLACWTDGVMVRSAVIDNGPGIPLDVLPRLFQPFVTTKPPSRGTGLGLYITREIISRHKGVVDIASQPGLGTTVTFALPLEDAFETAAASSR